MAYNLTTHEKKKIVEKKWDITSDNSHSMLGSEFTTENSYMAIYINEDGKSTAEVLDAKSMQSIELPDFGEKSVSSISFSNDEESICMYVGGSSTPADLYSYNLNTKELKKLTNVLNNAIHAEDLISAKVIRYQSFDGTTIPAIYYLPHQASAKNKVPAMVWVHGGPGMQSLLEYNSLFQYLANHGYAVLAINNRGSSGYGKTFNNMDDLNHGEKDLQDCVEGKNWLAAQAEIEGDKIGIMGHSYGGFMTMAALSFTPEEFAVGVNLYGVTNWIRTLRSIPPYWKSIRESLYKELGDPYSADSVRLKRVSPLFHTDKVTKPLIVLQGAQDPRVLQVESDEIVSNIRENNVPVEYVLFEDEGHEFIKKENQIKAYSSILIFLDNYLRNENKAIEAK
jgi:dipeptidyl aminopeptidase/acylaminoacyl peptidase